jgi:DNA-directed RNA polymerase specialized sigma subunit
VAGQARAIQQAFFTGRESLIGCTEAIPVGDRKREGQKQMSLEQQELVIGCLRLAYWYVRKRHYDLHNLEDLKAQAALAICVAATSFSAKRGFEFISFAYRFLRIACRPS